MLLFLLVNGFKLKTNLKTKGPKTKSPKAKSPKHVAVGGRFASMQFFVSIESLYQLGFSLVGFSPVDG